MKRFAAAVCLLSAFLLPPSAFAQAPQFINYQARLLNGTNLVNGSVGLSLRLFDVASGGAKIYEDSNTVTVADGSYFTYMGDNTTTGSLINALTNPAVYLEVAVNNVALSPRERLASVGYSLATRGISVDASNTIFVLNQAENTVDPTAGHSTIGGGAGNNIQADSDHSFLGGGNGNSILFNTDHSFLGGGFGNALSALAHSSFLGGGERNSIGNDSDHSFLGGGYSNSVTGIYGVVPGGDQNVAAAKSFAAGHRAKAKKQGSFVWADSTDANFETSANNQFLIRASGGVGIGKTNPVSALDVAGTATASNFVGSGGGLTNVYSVRGIYVDASNNIFVLNQAENTVDPTAGHSTLGGGAGNNIQADSDHSFLGGGNGNSIQFNTYHSFLGGGFGNTLYALAHSSFLGGGERNSIGNDSDHSFLGGGYSNSVTGIYGVVPGGDRNVAAAKSFAAGHRAKAKKQGSFVWADSTDADFETSANNQFLIRASGGVGIGKTNPVSALDVAGTVTASNFAGSALDLNNAVQNVERLRLSGQEFFQAGNTSTNGISFLLGVNRTKNRQLWVADSALLAVNASNATIRLTPENPASIDAIATDGSTPVPLQLGAGQAMTLLPGGNVGIGTATPNRPLAIKGADAGGGFAEWISLLNTNGVTKWHLNNNGGGLNFVETDVKDFRLFLAPGGNVGIGTNSPSASLDVNDSLAVHGFANFYTLAEPQLAAIDPLALAPATNGTSSANPNPGGSILTVWTGQDADRGLRVADRFTSGANMVLQPLASSNVAALNFNGYYAAGDQRFNTSKSRWRVGANQGGSADELFIDSYNGSGSPVRAMTVKTGGTVTFSTNVGIGVAAAAGVPLTVKTSANAPSSVIADFKTYTAGSSSVEIRDNTHPFGGGLSLVAFGNVSVGGDVSANTFTTTSDRDAKENFTEVDAEQILEKIAAMPITRWNFKTASDVLHIGPMAQDFRAAFNLGMDEKHIATVDADGVALAAIQALAAADRDQRSEARDQKAEIRSQQEKIEAQERMILDLRARLEALEKK